MSKEGDEDGVDRNLPARGAGAPGEAGGDDVALPEELREMLDKLPEDEREKVTRMASLFMVSSWSGLLPQPEDYRRYELADPGTAKELRAMAKKEQAIKEAVLVGQVANDGARLSNDRLLVWVLMAAVVGIVGVAALAVWLKQPSVAMFLTGLSAVVGIALRLIGVMSAKKGGEERSEGEAR